MNVCLSEEASVTEKACQKDWHDMCLSKFFRRLRRLTKLQRSIGRPDKFYEFVNVPDLKTFRESFGEKWHLCSSENLHWNFFFSISFARCWGNLSIIRSSSLLSIQSAPVLTGDHRIAFGDEKIYKSFRCSVASLRTSMERYRVWKVLF